jgi:hypothetical protein
VVELTPAYSAIALPRTDGKAKKRSSEEAKDRWPLEA